MSIPGTTHGAEPRARIGRHARWAALGLALLLAGCGSSGSNDTAGGGSSAGSGCAIAPRAGVFADRVVSYAPINSQSATQAQWPYFYQPLTVLGAPCGDDAAAGGRFDGISLGYDPSAASALGGTVILGFGDGAGHRCAVDDGTTAPDMAVYGNAFYFGSNGYTYAKIATVEVAQTLPTNPADAAWHLLVPSFDPGYSTMDPRYYVNFAGVTPTSAGGDRFDLSALPAGLQACYVRLTDGGKKYPDWSNTQTDLYAGGAAIDAVEALHSTPAP